MTRRTAIPDMIGRYEVILPIASGGMATVYLARQHGLAGFERNVALKVMHPHLGAEECWRTEFVEEAKLAAAIRHPNVVEVVDVGEDPLGLYLVMSYVEGESVAGIARGARGGPPMDRSIVLRILVDALAGLHAAHVLADKDGRALDVVHRDFSPQNVLVGTDGISRLTDFGIAKAESRLTFTSTGTVKGKLGYMSPEQARGQPVDRRCDVWAAGVVAWELLANQLLYPRGDDLTNSLRLATERPVDLREIDPTIPSSIAVAVRGALEADLQRRCPTAAELSRQLAAGQPIADQAIVGSLVSALVREKLATRQERARDIAEERREVDRRASHPSTPGAPSVRRLLPSVAPRAATHADDVTMEELSKPVGPVVEAARTVQGGEATRAKEPGPWRRARSVAGALVAAVAIAALSLSGRLRGAGVARPVESQAQAATPPSVTALPSQLAATTAPLVVTADVPVLALRVGAQDIVPPQVSTTLRVEVDEALLASQPDVEAVTTDGRRSTLKLPAGTSVLTFHFGAVDAPDATFSALARTTRRPPRPPGHAPAAVRASRPGLANNPYGGPP